MYSTGSHCKPQHTQHVQHLQTSSFIAPLLSVRAPTASSTDIGVPTPVQSESRGAASGSLSQNSATSRRTDIPPPQGLSASQCKLPVLNLSVPVLNLSVPLFNLSVPVCLYLCSHCLQWLGTSWSLWILSGKIRFNSSWLTTRTLELLAARKRI